VGQRSAQFCSWVLQLLAKVVVVLAEFSEFGFPFGDLIEEVSELAKDASVMGGDPEAGSAAHGSSTLSDPIVDCKLSDSEFL